VRRARRKQSDPEWAVAANTIRYGPTTVDADLIDPALGYANALLAEQTRTTLYYTAKTAQECTSCTSMGEPFETVRRSWALPTKTACELAHSVYCTSRVQEVTAEHQDATSTHVLERKLGTYRHGGACWRFHQLHSLVSTLTRKRVLQSGKRFNEQFVQFNPATPRKEFNRRHCALAHWRAGGPSFKARAVSA
jgi:hypothetical protein